LNFSNSFFRHVQHRKAVLKQGRPIEYLDVA
jgi:hypothetical protein